MDRGIKVREFRAQFCASASLTAAFDQLIRSDPASLLRSRVGSTSAPRDLADKRSPTFMTVARALVLGRFLQPNREVECSKAVHH